jgi:DNA repair protein SbcC/Rad50
VRPLGLALEGFTAFRDRQDVDFSTLELFVITGPTGAGKTSLLDAMTFALYGQVPRLGGTRGTRDLISLGRAEARVSFEFSVDGQGRFRVARRLRRTGASQTVTLERHVGGEEWAPVVDQGGVRMIDPEIVAVIGLDFDSFCRAVVLPQGEFHRFLKGDPGERRKVLFSLLGVGYFQRMAELARARMNVLKVKLESTEQIIAEQFGDATDAVLAESRRAAEAARVLAARVTAGLTAAEERIQAAADQHRRAHGLATQLAELRVVGGELEALAVGCEEAEAASDAARASLSSAEAATAARRASVAEAESTLVALEGEYGTLEQLASVAAAAASFGTAAQDEDAAALRARAAEAEADAATAAKEAAERERAEREAALAEAHAADDQARNELEAARRSDQQIAGAVTVAVRLDAERAAAREQAELADTAAREAAREAEAVELMLAQAITGLEQRRRHAAVADLAEGLSSGDACPVCGVVLATAVHVEGDVKRELENAVRAESAARSAALDARRQSTRADAQREGAVALLARAQSRLAEALGGAGELAALLEQRRTAATALADRERAATARREVLGTARESCESGRRGAEVASAAAARAVAAAESERRAHEDARRRRETTTEVLYEHFGDTVPLDAADQVRAQHERLSEALAAVRRARAELDAAVATESATRAGGEQSARRLAEIDVCLAGLSSRADAAARALKPAIDLGDARSDEAALGARLGAIRSWCAEAELVIDAEHAAMLARADGAQREVAAIAAQLGVAAAGGPEAITALRAAEHGAREAAVRAQAAVEQTERRLESRRQMEEQIAEDRRRSAVLGSLAQDLRQDRFGEYIVQETLGMLAAHASEELLRISDGRYSLAAAEGDFEVVDHANADERRSVRTLSGGETFLASLALALALSRHIGELASEGLGARLEAVFIDEGFGTLDPATLEEVIEALERLRADELMVGVISHVPELADRIKVGLEVRTEEGRSRVVVTDGE